MDPLILLIVVLYSFLLSFLAPIYLGSFLFHRHRYRAALLCFRWLYSLTPLLRKWRGPAAGYLAACYAELEDYERAQPYAEEAIRENGRRGYGRFLLSSMMYMGTMLSRQGEFEQAERLFDQALTVKDAPTLLRRWTELHAANVYLMRGRREEAERLLQRCLEEPKLRPEMQATTRCALGICHFYVNDLPAALECAQQARSIANVPAWVRVMTLSDILLYLAEMGDIAEGKKIEAELLPLLPMKPASLEQRAIRAVARLALAAGDLDRARDYAERAERTDPNPNGQAGALLIQAEVFAARHNVHRAVRLCEAILESRTIDFYKAKAEALRQRLQAHGMQPVITAPQPTLTVVQEAPAVQILHAQT